MSFTIEIDRKLKIIRNTYSGIVVLENLAEVWRQLLSLNEFRELKYNLLSDYRSSKFDITHRDTDSAWQFLLSIKSILKEKKEGAILNNPYDTALSMIFQLETLEKLDYSVKLFSTEKAALEWLNDSI